MSLSEQQTKSLLNLVGLSEKKTENQSDQGYTDRLDRLVRAIHMGILMLKDDLHAKHLHGWPRLNYGPAEINTLLGKSYLTMVENNILVNRLAKLNISAFSPTYDSVVATMYLDPPKPPTVTKQRRHRRRH